MAAQLTYWFKDKPYKILFQTKAHINDEWIPVVVYVACYENADGQFWVRGTKEFFDKFKTKNPALNVDSLNVIPNLKQEQDNHNE